MQKTDPCQKMIVEMLREEDTEISQRAADLIEQLQKENKKLVKALKKANEQKSPKCLRAEQIQKFNAGKPYTYVGKRTGPFICDRCCGKGNNAIVLKDKNGKNVLVGGTCCQKYAGRILGGRCKTFST